MHPHGRRSVSAAVSRKHNHVFRSIDGAALILVKVSPHISKMLQVDLTLNLQLKTELFRVLLELRVFEALQERRRDVPCLHLQVVFSSGL